MPAVRSRVRRFSFRSRPTSPVHNSGPISDLNITPLIDVLLVLLVMIMLSIPIALHKVEIDIPAPGPNTGEPAKIYSVHLNAAGNILWDGETIGDAELKNRLAMLVTDPDRPQLHLQTDGIARYERFDQVIATIKKSGVQAIGFVGNDQFANWDSESFD